MSKEISFPVLLQKTLPEIAKALPKHLTAERMGRIALTAFRQNPALAECDPMSIIACVVQSAQLGLELGVSGHAFLVPYNGRCQFVPGWRGLVDLVSRAGRSSVHTGVIHQGQEYRYTQGARPDLAILTESDEDKPIIYAYAVGWVKGAEWPVIEMWSAEKLMKHRDRYNKVGKRHYSYANWEMYCRKVVLLQVLKYMPSSVELSTAIALNDAAEVGNQGVTVEGAIDWSWTPPERDEIGAPDGSEPSSTREGVKVAYAGEIQAIKEHLGMGDVAEAKRLWAAIPQADQIQLWVAPTKGGCFTTEEREQLR